MTSPSEEFAELLTAMVSGAVLADGRPVTPSTIGALMHEYGDALEAEYGETVHRGGQFVDGLADDEHGDEQR